MGLTATVITDALEALSKCVVSERVKAFIRDCTVGYGKVKLVLSQGKYFLESNFPSVLRQLNKNEVVKRARVKAVEVCPRALLCPCDPLILECLNIAQLFFLLCACTILESSGFSEFF